MMTNAGRLKGMQSAGLGCGLEHKAEAFPVTAERCILGESPVWSARDERLYWVDIRSSALHRLDPSTGESTCWFLPQLAAAVLLRQSGGLVLALKSGLYTFEPDSGTLQPLLDVDEGWPGNRLNDCRCDRSGAIWFSTMWDFGCRTTGALYRLTPDLSVKQVRDRVTIPNAISFSRDGGIVYFADTPTLAIEAASLDPGTGCVGPWRIFAAGTAAPGKPDGATVDSEGYLWNARYGGGCVARFAPDGNLDRIVPLPVSQPTSCAFGGPNLATLYVTTARQGLDDVALAAQPFAGAVLALHVGVRGLPEPSFAA